MAKPGIINVIGDIGGMGVTLAAIMEQVKSQPRAKEFLVNINSPGGEVTEGYAIHNYLVGLGKPITTRGIGLVASIATVVFMAGRKRELYTSTQFLIHNPWTFGEGDADAMERKASELRDIENGLVNFYNLQTGADIEALKELMRADRFISADQALELRFATEVLTPIQAYATIKTPKNDKMSKVGKIIKDAFAALRASGLVFNEAVMTADGQELEITMVGEAIAAGDTVTLGGEPATGEFTLADGTILKAENGIIMEVMSPMVEEAVEGEDVAALKATIANLQSQLDAVKADNTEMATNLEVITNHLRKLKVNASVPTKKTTFNRTTATAPAEVEQSKEEIKARFDELRRNSGKRTTIAI
jgi:ATP-dependent Clp endopeptidase proteolytic subunit ClpP